jgi:hypothetical protein
MEELEVVRPTGRGLQMLLKSAHEVIARRIAPTRTRFASFKRVVSQQAHVTVKIFGHDAQPPAGVRLELIGARNGETQKRPQWDNN